MANIITDCGVKYNSSHIQKHFLSTSTNGILMENSQEQLKLVRYCTFFIHYNNCFVSVALSIILKQHPPSELMKHTDINLTVQGLLPYTGQ